jgi:hypothetical protein
MAAYFILSSGETKDLIKSPIKEEARKRQVKTTEEEA